MPEFRNYTINSQIGRGAQGIVHLATHNKLGRKVAIKSLHPELITSASHKDRFIKEAELLAQLNHPSIVIVYDYIDDDGFHLVMEYLDGNPIDFYIREISGPIKEIRAIDIFIKILEGLKHIHEKNIVHRDIKPSNIMIDDKDNIKLLDFGIAKDYQNDPQLTRLGQNVGGTPMYMSPEHISNTKINMQSDIYSLGITFWQMLTGKSPYENLTEGEIYSRVERDALPPIQDVYPHVSIRMNDIIQKATAKNLKDRYDSCSSFIEALNNLKQFLLKAKQSGPGATTTTNIKSKIEVKVITPKGSILDDASIIINNEASVGSELTYYGMPGTKARLTVHKEGYRKYLKQFTINDDREILVTLQKKQMDLRGRIFLIINIILIAIILFLMLTLTT